MGDVEVEEILHWSKWGGLRLHNSWTCSPLNIFTCKSCDINLLPKIYFSQLSFASNNNVKDWGKDCAKVCCSFKLLLQWQNLTLIKDAIRQNAMSSNRHRIVEILKSLMWGNENNKRRYSACDLWNNESCNKQHDITVRFGHVMKARGTNMFPLPSLQLMLLSFWRIWILESNNRTAKFQQFESCVCSLFFLSLNFKSGILHVLSTLSLSSDLHQGPISPTYSTHRSSQTKEGVVPEIYCWLGIGYWVLGIG